MIYRLIYSELLRLLAHSRDSFGIMPRHTTTPNATPKKVQIDEIVMQNLRTWIQRFCVRREETLSKMGPQREDAPNSSLVACGDEGEGSGTYYCKAVVSLFA